MEARIAPARSVTGSVTLPGDKSISHRYAMLAAIAHGASRIRNYASGADCRSTLGAVRALGIDVEQTGAEVVIHGRGLEGLRAPAGDIDAGNSGSTMRMLSGILAGQPFPTRMVGDASLSRRPMQRIITPLTEMGAVITARDGQYPPLEIRGGRLRGIDYRLPVASAQVKSCVLLAGLYADGVTAVREPMRSRDHTELALREFGAGVRAEHGRITVTGRPRLTGRELQVPSDLSSAAFFVVAALLVPGSALTIRDVGLNPTRAALLDVLAGMGAFIRVTRVESVNGELIGDLQVEYAPVRGGVIEGAATAALIDEVPVLAVLGAASEAGIVVRDARELRVKETDRIATVAENLRRMGVQVEESANGMAVPGGQTFRAATLDSFGDHRVAMAFAVAALRAEGECVIQNAEAASVSFPEFWDTLRRVAS